MPFEELSDEQMYRELREMSIQLCAKRSLC
jgi:hypothetical protein